MESMPLPIPALEQAGYRPASAPLLLIPGRLYYATILNLSGNQAVVAIGGHRFAAEVVGELPSSGTIPVLVREAQGERIVLQQAPETVEALPAFKASNDPLVTTLERLGLPARSEYIQVLPYMLRAGQPITAEALIELHTAWVQLTAASPAALPLLAKLQASGLPLVDATLAAAKTWQTPQYQLTTDALLRLVKSLSDLRQALEAEPLGKQAEPLPAFLRAFARALLQMPLKEAIDQTLPGQIATLVQTLSTPPEALLSRHRLALAAGPGSLAPLRATDGRDEQLSGRQADAHEPVLLNNPGTLKQGLPGIERNIQVQMRRLASLLDQLAESPERFSSGTRQCLAAARDQLGAVVQSLDAQHIANLRSAPDATTAHYYSFSLPVAWSAPGSDLSLRVHYRPGGRRKVDANDTCLSFHMQLQPLGTVQVDLRVFRRLVACDVRTQSSSTNELALAEAPKLREGLQRLGYQVQAIRCSIADDADSVTGDASPGLPHWPLAEVNVTV